MHPWPNWIWRVPPKDEVTGSNPVGCAKINAHNRKNNMYLYDIIIIGAGAAGLSAAGAAVAQNKRVLILEMGDTVARKVTASGGGRCNITNAAVAVDRYFGTNPNFVRSAIARVPYTDILKWANAHKINLVEKTAGRYFCENGAKLVTDALIDDTCGADIKTRQNVIEVQKNDDNFAVKTTDGLFYAKSVIVATGGTSFATLGVSEIGYKIAKQFGHKIIPVRPALCAIKTTVIPTDLAGIAMPVKITIGKRTIYDDLLFTHFGIGGPAAYRTSLFDMPNGIIIDFAPNHNIAEVLKQAKHTSGRKNIVTILSEYMPARVARWLGGADTRNVADIKDSEILSISNKIQNFHICADDIKLHGLAAAEVVRGGVSVDEISSKTMESKLCRGLFFAGEVLDVAGDLGGFNLHWAWASGRTAGTYA